MANETNQTNQPTAQNAGPDVPGGSKRTEPTIGMAGGAQPTPGAGATLGAETLEATGGFLRDAGAPLPRDPQAPAMQIESDDVSGRTGGGAGGAGGRPGHEAHADKGAA